MALVDVSYVFYRRSALHHGVREAGRWAMTGRTRSATTPDGTPPTRLESILWVLHQQSGLDLGGATVEVSSVSGDGIQHEGPGGPGDIVTIRVSERVALLTPILGRFFPEGQYAFQVGTSFKNEEF